MPFLRGAVNNMMVGMPSLVETLQQQNRPQPVTPARPVGGRPTSLWDPFFFQRGSLFNPQPAPNPNNYIGGGFGGGYYQPYPYYGPMGGEPGQPNFGNTLGGGASPEVEKKKAEADAEKEKSMFEDMGGDGADFDADAPVGAIDPNTGQALSYNSFGDFRDAMANSFASGDFSAAGASTSVDFGEGFEDAGIGGQESGGDFGGMSDAETGGYDGYDPSGDFGGFDDDGDGGDGDGDGGCHFCTFLMEHKKISEKDYLKLLFVLKRYGSEKEKQFYKDNAPAVIKKVGNKVMFSEVYPWVKEVLELIADKKKEEAYNYYRERAWEFVEEHMPELKEEFDNG